MRHWRGRVAGFLAGLLLGGWLIATPAAQSYVWGAINGIPFGPGLVLSGPILLPDGTVAAPALAFANSTTTGLSNSGGSLNFSAGGILVGYLGTGGFVLSPTARTGSSATSAQTLAQTWNTTGAPVLVDWTITDTASDAASLAFRIRGGAAGTTTLMSLGKTGLLTTGGSVISGGGFYFSASSRIKASGNGGITVSSDSETYATVLNIGPTTSNTARGSQSINNGLVTIDMATATGTGTGTVTSLTQFPAGVMVGMTCKVTTILAGAGLTTISIGDGTDADRWGAGIAIAANTTINIPQWTAAPPWTYAAATNIVVTAAAGVLSTGVLSCSPHYFTFSPIGS